MLFLFGSTGMHASEAPTLNMRISLVQATMEFSTRVQNASIGTKHGPSNISENLMQLINRLKAICNVASTSRLHEYLFVLSNIEQKYCSYCFGLMSFFSFLFYLYFKFQLDTTCLACNFQNNNTRK